MSSMWLQKTLTSHPFLFTAFHSFTAKHYTMNPPRKSCLHLIGKTMCICSQMPVTAPSGVTYQGMCDHFNLFLQKNLYNGFQGGYLIWSVLLPKRYNKIPSLLRENNGFPKDNRLIGRRGEIYIVIRYLLKWQVQRVCVQGLFH